MCVHEVNEVANGRICWTDADGQYPVRDAIVADDRIAFDLRADGEHYSVTLTPVRNSDMWTGTWRCRETRQNGHVDARPYKSADGGLVLVGTWQQDGDLWWFIELRS